MEDASWVNEFVNICRLINFGHVFFRRLFPLFSLQLLFLCLMQAQLFSN